MSDTYDLLVIGGGINGAGIARDAAGRGLRVLLVEKDDLASHTSSASTKLVHGGLRYLEHYEFRLVADHQGLVLGADLIEQAFGAFHVHQRVVGAMGDQGRAGDVGGDAFHGEGFERFRRIDRRVVDRHVQRRLRGNLGQPGLQRRPAVAGLRGKSVDGRLHPVDEGQLSDESLGFVDEKRVVALADSKEELAPHKVLTRVGVEQICEVVEPRKGAPVRGGVRIEEGMGVHQDGRYHPPGARLAGERRGRSGTEEGE